MIEARTAQYDVAYDSQRFIALKAMRGTVGYQEKLVSEIAYVEQQLATDLGERIGLAESKYVYSIRDGKLFGQGFSEPFDEVLDRGRFRDKAKKDDFEREKVELDAFRTIQNVLASPDTPDGTTFLLFSPRGRGNTNYEENYADTFTKEGDFVIARRYRSNLSNQESRQKVLDLNPFYQDLIPNNPTDIDLKSIPVIIPKQSGLSDPDSLIKYLLKEKIGASQKELKRIKEILLPARLSYINTLVNNPEALGLLEDQYISSLTLPKREIIYQSTTQDPVRIGSGGCGSANGTCSIGGESNLDTGIKITDEYGKLEFQCPDCKRQNTRALHELKTQCQYKDCNSKNVLPGQSASKSF